MTLVAHITDLHMPPLPDIKPGEWNVKRLLGYVSWHENRKNMHRADILAALIADMQAHDPGHICISGDMTNLGLEAEYARSAAFLEKLAPADKISLIPGNHEAYGPRYREYFRAYWMRWMKNEQGVHAGEKDAGSAARGAGEIFPYAHIRGNMAIIGVSSAVRTLPFCANGYVGRAQCERLGEILSMTRAQNLIRVLMIHHPPQPGGAPLRKALILPRGFRDTIRRHGAELILYGHNHARALARLPGAGRDVPVLGAGSASLLSRTKRAQYYLLEIGGDGLSPSIHGKSRVYDPESGRFQDDGADFTLF